MNKAFRPVLMTVAMPALFYAFFLIPLPYIDQSAELADQSGSHWLHWHVFHFNLGSLGIMPAVLSFFMVEIFSFFIGPLRRARKNGARGRRLLNKISLIFTLPLAAMLAFALLNPAFDMANPATGKEIIVDADRFLIFGISLLVLVHALSLVLAELISRWGIGNGFSLFIFVDVLENIFSKGPEFFSQGSAVFNGLSSASQRFLALFYIAFFLLGIVFLLKTIFKTRVLNTEKAGARFLLELPSLPQGIFIGELSQQLVMLPALIATFVPALALGSSELSALRLSLSTGALIVLLSYPLSKFLSQSGAIQKNLPPGVNLLPRQEGTILKQVWRSGFSLALIFLLLGIAVPLTDLYLGSLVSASSLLIIICVFKDLKSNFLFSKKFGRGVRVISLDNVHLAAHCQDVLTRENISFCIQAYHYRRLFFFTQPLVKMHLLVDSKATAARASEVLALPTLQIL